MDMQAQASHSHHRGTAQPETAEEKRRRLHREAAEAVKRHAAALREAKARYHEYDMAMAETATEAPHTAETSEATACEGSSKSVSGISP